MQKYANMRVRGRKRDENPRKNISEKYPKNTPKKHSQKTRKINKSNDYITSFVYRCHLYPLRIFYMDSHMEKGVEVDVFYKLLPTPPALM